MNADDIKAGRETVNRLLHLAYGYFVDGDAVNLEVAALPREELDIYLHLKDHIFTAARLAARARPPEQLAGPEPMPIAIIMTSVRPTSEQQAEFAKDHPKAILVQVDSYFVARCNWCHIDLTGRVFDFEAREAGQRHLDTHHPWPRRRESDTPVEVETANEQTV
jgi:hypothetical protein